MNLDFLKKGDVVDVVLPATSCDSKTIQQIKNFIKKIGLKPSIFFEKELVLKKATSHAFPSFGAQKRFEQFKKAVENSRSKIIWCALGGYGSAEIAPFLPELKKPKNKKLFIGFSDISSLNKILIEDWNWQVIIAPMLAQITRNKVSEKSIKAVVDLILGKTKKLEYKLASVMPLRGTPSSRSAAKRDPSPIRGDGGVVKNLTGGCLSVLAGNFGTKNQLNWNNKILFLEDEGESGERLDRYFHQLLTIMIEQKKFPSAIILGNFLEANNHGTPQAKNVEMAIKRFAKKLEEKNLKIPLLQEKSGCLGHSKNMLPLVLGAETNISKDGVLTQPLAS